MQRSWARPKMLACDVLTDNYKNISVANGRYWRQLRKVCSSELITPKRLATFTTVRAEEIHNMMKPLLEDTKRGRAVILKSLLSRITSNNMTRMLTNKRIFEIEKHRQRVQDRRGDEACYVPNFMDLLLQTPLHDGKVLPGKNITSVLMEMIIGGIECTDGAHEQI